MDWQTHWCRYIYIYIYIILMSIEMSVYYLLDSMHLTANCLFKHNVHSRQNVTQEEFTFQNIIYRLTNLIIKTCNSKSLKCVSLEMNIFFWDEHIPLYYQRDAEILFWNPITDTPYGRTSRVWDSCLSWSLGVREVMGSRPDRGNIVRRVFHPTWKLVRFSLLTCSSVPNSKLGTT